MTETGLIDTKRKARDLSTKKWERINTLAIELFNEADSRCGFCQYGHYQSRKTAERRNSCDLCTVESRCRDIQEQMSEIQGVLKRLIRSTLDFLNKMNVEDAD